MKPDRLRVHIVYATWCGDMPDSAVHTFDHLLEAYTLLKDMGRYDFDMVDIPQEGTYERELYDRLIAIKEKLK